jgi:hypothetical protein
MPYVIGLITASASGAAIGYSGLWLFARSGSYFGWGSPWSFVCLLALLSFVVARLSLGRGAARLFYLLGPIAWSVAALFWGGWERGQYLRGAVAESLLGLFFVGGVCARLAGLPTTRAASLSTTSLQEKTRELRRARSLKAFGWYLYWLFLGRLSHLKDGSHALQERALRMAGFWSIVSGSLALVLGGPLWCWLPGLLALCAGLLLRGSLLLRAQQRLAWFTRAASGSVANIELVPASTQSDLPLFYLGEGVDYDREIVFVSKSHDAYRGDSFSEPLALAPTAAPLSARLLWLRVAGLVSACALLWAVTPSLFYRHWRHIGHSSSTQRPCLANLDDDDDLDLLWLYGHEPGQRSLFISFNDGAGRFSSPYQVALSSFHTDGDIQRLEALDIDADGDVEPILISHEAYHLSFNQDALWISPLPLPMLPFDEADAMIVKDLDGDGDLDSIECSGARVNLNINERGVAKSKSELALGAPWRCAQLAWWEPDKAGAPAIALIADQLSSSYRTPHQLFFLGLEGLTLSVLREVNTPGLDTPAIADFNGDGRLDLLGANSDRFGRREPGAASFICHLYLGEGGDKLTFQQERDPCPSGYLFNGIATGDVDADGDADFVSVSYWMQVHLNEGGGSFLNPKGITRRWIW